MEATLTPGAGATDASSASSASNVSVPGLSTGGWRDAVPAGCVVLAAGPGAFVPWDNPANLVSRQLEGAVDRAVAVFCLPALFLLR